MIIHNIPPIFDESSKILILGSFPSIKSREENFFYGNPQNRFWRVVASVLFVETPSTVEEKRKMLLNQNIALWDVVGACEICGSSDSSIKNVVPNDITVITEKADIKKIYLNGATASRLFKKYTGLNFGIDTVTLPSTSPANARFTEKDLICEWKVIKETLKNDCAK